MRAEHGDDRKEQANSKGTPGQDKPAVRTPADWVLEVSAALVSAAPWIGGPVSSVLTGIAIQRRFDRVQEVLDGLAEDLRDFHSEASEHYVKTEEFEELLERTLRQAAEERNQEKRRLYRAFLAGAIKSPGARFEDQMWFLRTLGAIEPDHVRVLRALLAEPTDAPSLMGSFRQTLMRRLPEFTQEQVTRLVSDLDAQRLTNGLAGRLAVMMTGRGSADMRQTLTDYGRQFIAFLQAD